MFIQKWAFALLRPILAVIAALIFGFIIILIAGQNPFSAYASMIQGAFGGFIPLTQTLERCTPIILTGLATAIAFRSGVFNVGTEGSLYLGAFAAFLVGAKLHMPAIFHVPLTLLAAAVAGALWAGIPGYAKAKWKADEMVTTLLLNYAAILITTFLVVGPFLDRSAGAQETVAIDHSAQLWRFLPPSRVNLGLVLGILLALWMYWFFRNSKRGYEWRMMGMNPQYAEYIGVKTKRSIMEIMLLSGGIAGLAGAVQVMGILYKFMDQFSPGYGFDGITVALLARNSPIGVIFSGFFYGALQTGGVYMDRMTNVPKEVIDSVTAIIIFFVTAEGLFAFSRQNGAFRNKFRWIRRRNEVKRSDDSSQHI